MTSARATDRRIPISRLDPETLFPYLDLHLVGATNGVRLFQAARVSWAGTPYEEDFARLAQQIGEERDFLKRLVMALGHRPNLLKMGFAHVASVVARLDPLNPARKKSSGGAQLELEALQSLLRGKEALWATLLSLAPTATARSRTSAVAPSEDVLNRAALERLLETSKRQQDSVARVMTETAGIRFLLD